LLVIKQDESAFFFEKKNQKTFVHERAKGELRIALGRRGENTVLQRLRQEGCLKARFPRPEEGAWAGAVLLNSSGGIAGGDVLDVEVQIGAGAQATLAGQAAERFYRALPDTSPARLRTRLAVAAAGALEWLPQESILFDRCALDRALDVDLAEDAWFLGVERLVFGRAAMGEQVAQGWLRDLIRLRIGGRLVLHDAIRLDGPIASMLQRRAVASGGRAVATIVHAAPDAGAHLDAVRQSLAGSDAGASAWGGVLVARIVAADGAGLRAAVLAALEVLRQSRPLPRVWLC
jgi:urease accessory protein